MFSLFLKYYLQLSLIASWQRVRDILCILFFVVFGANLNVNNISGQSTVVPNLNWVIQDIESRLEKGCLLYTSPSPRD